MEYSYLIEECDVEDRVALAEYRKRRKEWLFLLQGDPDHAVLKQISSMLWNDAVFRTMNEARRLSRLGGYKASARTWSIARFMDQGFVATQALSIRRLMEKASTKPATQIVSLRRVLDEIKDRRQLITRENYVAYDGLPYDLKSTLSPPLDTVGGKTGVSFGWVDTVGPQAFDTAELVHKRFDRLSGTEAEYRSRVDLIRPEIFERIERTLSECGWTDIAAFGNKFIAHAADEHSRATLLDGQQGFSLDKLAVCHRGICQAAAALYSSILYEGSTNLIPFPQFDHFENLEEPWIKDRDIEALSAFWDNHVENVEQCYAKDLVGGDKSP